MNLLNYKIKNCYHIIYELLLKPFKTNFHHFEEIKEQTYLNFKKPPNNKFLKFQNKWATTDFIEKNLGYLTKFYLRTIIKSN